MDEWRENLVEDPRGVGPLTVAMVLHNTLKAARRRQGLP